MTTPDPARIVETLTSAGWQVTDSKPNLYVHLAWPYQRHRLLIIPLDPGIADYDDLLAAAIRALKGAVAVGNGAKQALAAYRPDLYAHH
ncbi:hypothetical protein [Paractinoplanes toevensis]|uniref:Uncharacterized protein n=1 Tax=Paractinoplanes toevensis TaxID=571911 RepID=A0A919T779_9ACTN|nr:hypothetical protein [Actinoplanes toevensis]GIM89697.1 hypothetical protein Ato02nite_014900 [Actinoplanes toevensis]